MITIEKLTVSYGSGEPVIRSLELQLARNMIHGIVGLNGAGKTTLLDTIYGLKKPSEGIVLLDGRKIAKADIAYLITENFFYSGITGREYLALFRNDAFNTDDWNVLFSLPLDKIIDNYSTGMKKKLALLGVLKQNKPVLMLDEPFNGLDMEACRNIRLILLRLCALGKTVIITSHIMETLTNLCDYIHYMDKGVVKFTVGKADFKEFEERIFTLLEEKNKELVDKLTDKL